MIWLSVYFGKSSRHSLYHRCHWDSINHFLLSWNTTSSIYYLQGNGQPESTNNVIGSLLTKLVNENCIHWYEHLHTNLYVYHTSSRKPLDTLFQLVYGLYLLMLTKYMLPMSNSYFDWNFFPTCILTNRMVELEHLDETRKDVVEQSGTRQWNTTLWAQQNHKIKIFSMGDIVI